MKKRPEAALWNRLKDATASRVDWDRIENLVGTGIPDVIGSVVYVIDYIPVALDFYLELKVSPTSKLSQNLWKPTQVAWQTRAARRGRTVYNLVHRPRSSSTDPQYYLYDGLDLLTLVTSEDPETVVPVAKSNDFNELIDAIVARHKARHSKNLDDKERNIGQPTNVT